MPCNEGQVPRPLRALGFRVAKGLGVLSLRVWGFRVNGVWGVGCLGFRSLAYFGFRDLRV